MENQPALGDTAAGSAANRKGVVMNAAAVALADTVAVYADDMYLPTVVRDALDRYEAARLHRDVAVAAAQTQAVA